MSVAAANHCSTAVSAELDLPEYHISPETGFLPATAPLTALPGEYFASWENIMSHLPELNKTKQLRTEVDKLPERDFNHSTLKSEEEWRRAYVVLCFIGQSYIWGEGQKRLIDKIPKKIAVPWCQVSDRLKLNPVGCYASTVLFNFRLIDPEGPWNANNLSASNTFTGSKDEDGFYVSFLLVELAAVPSLKAIGHVFQDMKNGNDIAVQSCLQAMKKSLQDMRVEMSHMAKRCKPVTFYTEIRPFQAGTKGLDAFSNGIIYCGVDLEPQQYRGANGGQSSTIYAIDIALGIRHYDERKDFMKEMTTYMPEKHRQFLEKLSEMPPIRDYCIKSGNAELIANFNATIEELGRFRSDHVIVVARFIVNQRRHSVNPTLNDKGSGGTDFMPLLKKIRNETLKFMIDQNPPQ